MTVLKGSRAAANEGDENEEDLEDETDDATGDKPTKATTVPVLRFKNLQRAFDKLQKVADKRQELLDDRDQEDTNTIAEYETEAIRLRAEVKKFAALPDEVARLTKENAAHVRGKSVRQSLSKPELGLGDIITFYDAGFFDPGDAEGDALLEKANAFKALLAGKFQTGMQETLAGAKPGATIAAAAGNAATAGMGLEELRTWLYKNPTHPDYAAYEEAFFTAQAAT